MATERNITMKQFNGIDYDTLYPKTIASQVDGVYNKEETISDTTKALYGLSSAAVPDDAFKKMPDKVNETSDTINPVGTIQTTVRTDLGDNWMLCDGSSFDPTEYPDLANVLNQDAIVSKKPAVLTTGAKMDALVYNDGYYVGAGFSSSGTYIFYTDNISSGSYWTSVKLISSSLSIAKLRYINGFYILITFVNSSPYTVSIWYTNNIKGSWSQKIITTNLPVNYLFRGQGADIAYFNNEYCLCIGGGDNAAITIMHCSTLDGEWSKTIVPYVDGQSILYNLTMATDGNVLGVMGQDGSGVSTAFYLQSNNINGPWTTISFPIEGSLSHSNPYLFYGNGYFVACGSTQPTGDAANLWIMYKKPSDSEFVTLNNIDVSYACQYNGMVGQYYNGKYYIISGISSSSSGAYYGVLEADNPFGPWRVRLEFSKNSNLAFYAFTVGSNQEFVIGGSDNAQNNPIIWYSYKKYLLPTITADKSYVYIKAKKDSET